MYFNVYKKKKDLKILIYLNYVRLFFFLNMLLLFFQLYRLFFQLEPLITL